MFLGRKLGVAAIAMLAMKGGAEERAERGELQTEKRQNES